MRFADHAHGLAHDWAEALTRIPFTSGRYSDALAAAVWHRLNPRRYAVEIEAALDHLRRREKPRRRYHTEFAAYGLDHLPPDPDLLRDVPLMRPKVANWLLLGARSQWQRRLVRAVFERDGLIHDTFPRGFSAGYHGFSTALLLEAGHSAGRAATTLRWLEGGDGYPNLLGRGAGQSFGAAASIYALSRMGDLTAAQRILSRLPQRPKLNPLTNQDRPGGPGWFNYNDLGDYTAFTALMVLKAADYRTNTTFDPAPPVWSRNNRVCATTTPTYRALMMGQGAALFDGAPQPVVIRNGRVVLPPVAAEPVPPGPYGPAHLALPALLDPFRPAYPTGHKARSDLFRQDFTLAQGRGRRMIRCLRDQIHIHDRLAGVGRVAVPRLILPDPLPDGVSIDGADPSPETLVSVAGPARIWQRVVCGPDIDHRTRICFT